MHPNLQTNQITQNPEIMIISVKAIYAIWYIIWNYLDCSDPISDKRVIPFLTNICYLTSASITI